MSDTPTPSQAAEKAEMPVIAYLRATKDEMPVWDGEDCVCQDPVYPSDPDGGDADCISMPVVRLSDAESQLAEMRAEVERLREDARRLDFMCDKTALRFIESDGDMWRVYQDEAPAEASAHHWLAIVSNWHATPREAIDAARRRPSCRWKGWCKVTEERDLAHEADMERLRREQLRAEFSPDEAATLRAEMEDRARWMDGADLDDSSELLGDPDEYDEEEPVCQRCHGDGMDPWNDYLLECPECNGRSPL